MILGQRHFKFAKLDARFCPRSINQLRQLMQVHGAQIQSRDGSRNAIRLVLASRRTPSSPAAYLGGFLLGLDAVAAHMAREMRGHREFATTLRTTKVFFHVSHLLK